MMRKLRVSQAVAAAVFAAGLSVGMQAQATTTIDGSDVGDLLLGPLYVTENGYNTGIHLQNTSDYTVIAKVRFRDYKNSNDAMDYTVVLSPKDIYTAYVSGNADGTPVLTSTDSSCTAPQTGNGGTITFPTSDDSPNKQSGHFEVFVEGVLDNDEIKDAYAVLAEIDLEDADAIFLNGNDEDLDDDTSTTDHEDENEVRASILTAAYKVVTGAKHANNVPADCGDVDSYFATDAANQLLALALEGGAVNATVTTNDNGTPADPTDDFLVVTGGEQWSSSKDLDTNVLTGQSYVLNASNGYAAGGRLTAVQDFSGNVMAVADAAAAAAGDTAVVNPCHEGVSGNLVCSQANGSAHLSMPNIMNVATTATTAELAANGTAAEEARVAAFQSLEDLLDFNPSNEWSSNEKLGVATDIVVTQFAKYAHRDLEPVQTYGSMDNNSYFGADYTDGDGDYSTDDGDDAEAWDDVDSILAGSSTVAAVAALTVGIDSVADDGTYKSNGCIDWSPVIYDREEDTTVAAPGVSVASGGAAAAVDVTELCNETTVFSFGGGVTAPGGAYSVDTSGVDQNFGSFEATFSPEDGASIPGNIGVGLWMREFAGSKYGVQVRNIGN